MWATFNYDMLNILTLSHMTYQFWRPNSFLYTEHKRQKSEPLEFPVYDKLRPNMNPNKFAFRQNIKTKCLWGKDKPPKMVPLNPKIGLDLG